jgi:predicted MFS family arabinose efflux permease
MTKNTTHGHLGRSFNALWLSSAISTLGDGLRNAALPLLTAAITNNPFAVSAVAFSGQLPWLLTSIVAGAIADRADRRRIMWTVDIIRAGTVLTLTLLVFANAPTIPLLCLVSFVLGAGQTLFDSAGQAFLPNVVKRSQLASANGRLATTRITVLAFVGPPLGGFLFAASAGLPFLIDALSYGIAAALVGLMLRSLTINVAGSESGRRVPFRQSISEGIKWLSDHKAMRAVVMLIAAVNFTQGITQSILVLFALNELHTGRTGFGLLLAASGAGGLVAGLCGGLLRRIMPTTVLFAATVVVTVPIFAILSITTSPAIASAMLFINSFAGITASVMLQTLRQVLVPNRLMARVTSVIGLVSVGVGLPLGSALGGIIAKSIGLRAPFILSATVIAAACIFVPQISRALASASAKIESDAEDEQ